MDLEASRAWDAHNGPRLPAWAVAAAEETMEALLSSLGVARAFPLAELASHQRLGACLSGRQHSGKTTVVRHLAWKLQRRAVQGGMWSLFQCYTCHAWNSLVVSHGLLLGRSLASGMDAAAM